MASNLTLQQNETVVGLIKELIWELGYTADDVKELTIKNGRITAKLKSNDTIWRWIK